MLKSKLYSNLVDATNKIVNQFGKSVIQEDRFVNILSDMCPDRDNPAVFRIIRSAIQDDLLKNVIFSDVKSIENQVAFVSSALSKRYGYDKSLVEGILFSIAIGYGTISAEQYDALKKPQNKLSPKKILPPKHNNNQNKQNPSKNTTNIRKNIKIDGSVIKYVLILIWGMLGLTISPLLYLNAVEENQGFCFIGSLGIAMLHFFTLVPIAGVIDGHPSLENPKTYPSIAGAMYGLMICGIIFWVVFPVLFGFDFVLDIWGLRIEDSFPWITTIMANLFCAGILASYLEEIERFSGIQANYKKELFQSVPFKRGFIIVVVYFLLIGFFSIIAPTVSGIINKYNIYRINSYIDDVNSQKLSLKKEREKEQRNLSFAQFSLDESYAEIVSKIRTGNEFEIKSPSTYNESLFIHEDNYISIIDSIIILKTQWNNEIITLELFFVKDKLSAIRYSPLQTKGDSIISIYTTKYGDPEYELKKYIIYVKDEYPKDMPEEDIDDKYIDEKYIYGSVNLDKDELYPDSYYWTYKNSLIKIDYDDSYDSYNYEIRNRATITYFSRKIEPVLKRKKEVEAAIQKENNKKRNDSIRRVRETERRKQKEEELRIKEQKRQEELNHKRSIEQI